MVRKAVVRKPKPTGRKTLKRTNSSSGRSRRQSPGPLELREIESLRGEIERVARTSGTPRWNAKPDEVRRSVVKLVLTLVDFVRQLLERQALRRVDANTLTPAETEAIGIALMQLEATVRDLAAQFDLKPDDLNLDLGPIGKLV